MAFSFYLNDLLYYNCSDDDIPDDLADIGLSAFTVKLMTTSIY